MFCLSLVSVRDADIFSRDRERVACGCLDNPFLEHPRFQSERHTCGRACEFTKKFLAISFEEWALLCMRKIRDDVNDARATIA